MKLRQTWKEQIADQLHVVYEDTDTNTSFVYVGEKIQTADEILRRLKRLLKTETWKPNEVYSVWRQLETMEA